MKQLVVEILAIVALSCAVAGVSWQLRGGAEGLPAAICDPAELDAGSICFADAARLENVLWVDARTRELWVRNGQPGSVLLTDHPSEDWPSLLEDAFEHIAMADNVVVYCATEGCGSSGPVSQKIRSLEILPSENIYVLAGGWKSLVQ